MDTSNRISDITFIGDSMDVFPNQHDTDLAKKLEIIKKFIGTHNDYSSISIYNKTGIKIVDNKGIGIGENVLNEPFFKKAIQGDIYRDRYSVKLFKILKRKRNPFVWTFI